MIVCEDITESCLKQQPLGMWQTSLSFFTALDALNYFYNDNFGENNI